MRGRQALFRHIQAFFEAHLRGIFRYDEIEIRPAEDAPRITGKRRYAYGKTKEIVHVGFGGFEMVLLSPVECPPLGRVELRKRDAVLVTGPIDPETFKRVAIAIKSEAIATTTPAEERVLA